MFDKEYYKNKKEELERKMLIKKDEVIQEITHILNKFWNDFSDLNERYQEILNILKKENEGESGKNN
ncbi:MAG: hypothetical protein NC926_06460 [Candidatus Omnitrophica bacterium]|nr:hypothetical protein [Candidatus Omnitrophota bacterium]